jgi:hypothetical protein
VAQGDGKGHNDQARKRKIYVHDAIARIIRSRAILNTPQKNKKFGFMM